MTDTSIPNKFAAGTTVRYSRRVANRLPANGWTLKAYLVGPSRLEKLATASVDGQSFDVELSAAETQALLPGIYTYAERVENGTDVYVVGECTLAVTPDVSVLLAGENRTADEKLLEAIDKVIAGRIDADVEQYSIKDRALTKIPFAELVAYRGKLATKVAIARRGLASFLGGGAQVTFSGSHVR